VVPPTPVGLRVRRTAIQTGITESTIRFSMPADEILADLK
jgi:hypothetical protein